ncbi:unnamed protein product [Oppiella nova]|uniref:Uncharacterized protein n=1 Tax=Oppiella nova TaxID=334625 RepID=A0A7R9M3W8_9ACAR|nr:unnamed protein product [Oppiella nova]CAG2170090.1 unnamed protein product [Oppiella nova]
MRLSQRYLLLHHSVAVAGESEVEVGADGHPVGVHRQEPLNNIDTAALQRFASSVKRDPIAQKSLNGVADNVRAAAEAHGPKFYVMWDISGWTNFATELIEDYDTNIKRLVSSKAYAHQNGKPVVCIWGLGVSGRPNNTAGAIALIAHLKKEGLYVVGGVAKQWRTDTTAWKDVYTKLDMLQPWTVGSFGNVKGAEDYKKTLEADLTLLKQHNIDYQPVLFAGFTWANWQPKAVRNQIPREHGDFMWRQFVNVRELDIPSCYVAMFDEYDEGTAIAKAAENKSMIPTDQWFLTMDADGVAVSADFYLRLAGDGNRMMQKQIPLTQTHPTKHYPD